MLAIGNFLIKLPIFNPQIMVLHRYVFNSYTMGMSGLPDIYTRSPRAAGPRAEGEYISRTTSTHGITVM